MRIWRIGLGISTTILLAAGYLASQIASMNGTAAEYAAKVDQTPINLLAAILLAMLIASGYLPSETVRESQGETE